MYAIVRIAGNQYRAEPGRTIVTQKLPHEVGTEITIEDVLLISDDAGRVTVGQPNVAGATVRATVAQQFKGKKIRIFKYKPKVRYRVRKGHRQLYTRLMVDSIIAG